MDFIRQKAATRFKDETPAVAQRKRQLVLDESPTWGPFVAGTTERQSLKFFWLEECIDGDNPFVVGTFGNMLAEIARPALERADVKLGRAVTGVRWDEASRGVAVVSGKSISESEEELFDEVIVTTPLGWLKRNMAVFEPPLPQRLVKAIESLGYGNLDKVRLGIPRTELS